MNVQNIQEDKQKLITWINELQDVSLIDRLKCIKEDAFSIPKWQMKEVDRRMIELDEYPEKAIDFDAMMDSLEKKHGL